MNKFQAFLQSGWKWIVNTATRLYRGVKYGDDQALSDVMSMNAATYIPQSDLLAGQLADGSITIGQWQNKMASIIKKQHIQAAIAGKGGRAAMTAADWGRTGGRLGFQYKKLDSFARDIYTMSETGTPYSLSYVKARSRLYAKTFRTAYYDGKTAAEIDADKTEERRLLGVAEHCPDCVLFDSMGWQPIGFLPEPGQGSQCLSNCQCTKIYR